MLRESHHERQDRVALRAFLNSEDGDTRAAIIGGRPHFSVIDTHCHLSFSVFDGRIAEEIAVMRAAGVDGAITIGTTSKESRRAQAIAEAHVEIHHSAGVHPLYSHEPVDWGELHDAAAGAKCVAWGELGLDRHHPTPPFALQREVLEEQLDRIARWSLAGLAHPLVIHCRDAFDDLLPILERTDLPHDRMVFHCFSGTPAEAERVLEFGASISFTGIVTYANAPLVAEAAKLVPRDRLMIETDSPFLSPEPLRRQFPNRPAHVVHVAAALARIRGEAIETLVPQLDANARRFFGLPRPAVA